MVSFLVELTTAPEFQYALSFCFFFALSYFSLKKIIFGEEKAIAGIVAAIVSTFITGYFITYIQTLTESYDVAMYVFIFGAFLGVFLLAQLVYKLGTTKLKYLAVIYFIAWIFRSYYIPSDFENSIPEFLINFINVLGIVTGIITLAALIGIFNEVRRGKVGLSPEEKLIREKTLALEAEQKRNESDRKKAEAQAKAEQAEATKLALERQKEADFQRKVQERYLKKVRAARAAAASK